MAKRSPTRSRKRTARSKGKITGSTFELACGGIVRRRGPGGRDEVLLVHRESYDDWSLPKGKFEPREDATVIECAIREVLEETGVRARVSGFAGQTMYMKNGRPKLVLFWDMAFKRAAKFTPNDEIAGIAWLATKAALKRLTHEDERNVLAAAVGK